ncbi:MAG: TonB family protein, partial [Pseudomonadota bacterium]|nr:TonB family protein [Pseudomonadota bacterium]
RFVIDRAGQVLSYQVERSSGHRLLDQEVERIIRRAAPLPAMPSEMTLSKLELVVPFSFYTR